MKQIGKPWRRATYGAVALFVWLSSLSSGFGQSLTFQVRDLSDWRPLPQVEIIRIAGDSLPLGRTDEAGLFTWARGRALVGEQLLFQLPGYQPQNLTVDSVAAEPVQVLLDPLIYRFDEIVFTANKFQESREDLPHQIEVIKRQQIVFNNPRTAADMLEQVGVFTQRSQVGGGSPNLRGFEANKVLLVIDGVRMNNAIYRSGHLQNVLTIDPDLVQRTELLFGPASVMYGSDALGGVMHFYSRDPQLSQTEKPRIDYQGYARVGTATGERSAHSDVNLGFRRWGVLTSATWRQFGDLKTGGRRPEAYPDFGRVDSFVTRQNGQDQVVANPDPDRLTPSGYEQLDLFQKWYFLASDELSHTVNLQYSTSTDIPRFDRLRQQRNGRLRFAEWYYGPQERFLSSYRLFHTPQDGWYDQLAVVAAYQRIEESRHSRAFRDPWRNSRLEQVQVGSLNLDARKELPGQHELAYGAELIWNGVASRAFEEQIETGETGPLDTRYPDGGTEVWTGAAYFTHRWELSPRWTLTDGLRATLYALDARFDDKTFFPFEQSLIEQNNQALSGNLGAVFQPGAGWRLAAMFATGFRAPNLDDIAKVFDSQPGNVVVPNPGLQPEYTYNAELTLGKRWGDRISTEITGWYTRYANAIVVRDFSLNGQDSILYDGVLSNVQANVNAREAYIAGLTHSLRLQGRHWYLRHSLTWTYGQERETNVPMDHIPPLFGQAEAQWRQGRWQLQARMAYQGWKRPERYAPRDEANAEFATEDGWPAWYRIDLQGSYALSEYLRVQVGVDNLLDQHYRPFQSRISAPGRNIWMAVRGVL